MCIGEYPNNITVDISNVTQDTFSVSKAKSDSQLLQVIFRKNILVPTAGTFIACIFLNNNGGEFLLKPTFQFGT